MNIIKEQRGVELARLEEEWKKEYRKIKKYRLLMQGAQKRLTEIEKKIKEI